VHQGKIVAIDIFSALGMREDRPRRTAREPGPGDYVELAGVVLQSVVVVIGRISVAVLDKRKVSVEVSGSLVRWSSCCVPGGS